MVATTACVAHTFSSTQLLESCRGLAAAVYYTKTRKAGQGCQGRHQTPESHTSDQPVALYGSRRFAAVCYTKGEEGRGGRPNGYLEPLAVPRVPPWAPVPARMSRKQYKGICQLKSTFHHIHCKVFTSKTGIAGRVFMTYGMMECNSSCRTSAILDASRLNMLT